MSEKIDRYQIVRELGRGGMATVYLAHDPRFDRQVALKVLPRQFLHDYTFLERFNREARTIARLEHTAIVPVYDFGEVDGQPFLVMRYMSGGSLTERLQQGALPLPQVVDVLRRLGDALDYSHSRGVVHRDLKPGNILFDDRDNAFLSDFGIAKLAEATATLTGTAIIGTPAYMSPEQAQGNLTIDGRSDVYALGIILFQMLTGRLPFEANTPAKQLVAHILSPIPLVSAYRPDLPPNCDRVISHAMAKNRDERFSTASQMAEALVGLVQRDLPTQEAVLPPEVVQQVQQEAVREEDGRLAAEEDKGETAVSAQSAPPVNRLEPTEVMPEPETPPAYRGETTLVDTGQQPSPPPDLWEATVVEDEVFIVEQESGEIAGIGPLAPRSLVTPSPVEVEKPQVTRPIGGWMWAVVALAVLTAVGGGVWLGTRNNPGPGEQPALAAGGGSGSVVLKAFIEEHWAQGFDATDLTYGNGVWAVVMSQEPGAGTQTWHANLNFPREFIEERWESGFDVTNLAYGDGRWVVMMTRNAAADFQTWHVDPEFPAVFIEQKWREGFGVTNLVYGDGRWAVVMSRSVGEDVQTWHASPEFPREFIETKWHEGFDVTSLAYGDGRWAVVMSYSYSEDADFQTWHVAPNFPKEFIEEKWREGFDVTSLAYGDGRWVVVMSRRSNDVRQTWQTAYKFN